jgi:hypothetical protein
MNAELWQMGAIPVHLERRFEQGWASRFRPHTVAVASKNVGAQSKLPHSIEASTAPGKIGKAPVFDRADLAPEI